MLDPAPASVNRNELKMDDEDFFKGHVRKFMKHVETMPEKQAQKYAMWQNASISFGFLTAFCMGAILPDQEDTKAI